MNAGKNLILVGAAVAGLALGGCGSPGAETSSAAPTVSGAVSSDSPMSSVALRDSSAPARELSSAPGAGGAFTFDVSGLTPPFALRAQGAEGTLYTVVSRAGNADVNELTTAAVACAARTGSSTADDAGEDEGGRTWSGGVRDTSERMGAVLRSLRTVLKPLFDLYGVTRIGGDDEGGDPSGMRALLRDVAFTVQGGTLTVTNRATGAVIYAAPLTAITSGTFHPETMPAGPGGTPPPAACTYTYGAWGACQSNGTQTRTVASATPTGCSGTPVLTQACTYTPPPPAACTYTYSDWGACQSNNTQVRTVVSATPSGCAGTPVLSQACTYTPPIDGAALYTQKCSGCHGALATSSVRGMTAAQITAAGMTQGLSAAQVQAVADALK